MVDFLMLRKYVVHFLIVLPLKMWYTLISDDIAEVL